MKLKLPKTEIGPRDDYEEECPSTSSHSTLEWTNFTAHIELGLGSDLNFTQNYLFSFSSTWISQKSYQLTIRKQNKCLRPSARS